MIEKNEYTDILPHSNYFPACYGKTYEEAPKETCKQCGFNRRCGLTMRKGKMFREK